MAKLGKHKVSVSDTANVEQCIAEDRHAQNNGATLHTSVHCIYMRTIAGTHWQVPM
jgi:hypothetical protein